MGTLNPWSDKDTETALALRAQGNDYHAIGDRLGRTGKAVQTRLRFVSRTGAEKEALAANRKRYQQERAIIDRGGVVVRDVPDDVIARRDVYINAPKRDLSGVQFGDPPMGFSALDMRGNA